MKKLSEKAKELAGASVLLVDDDEYVVDVIKEIISYWIPDTDSVKSGNEAIERIIEKEYDFILSDIRMPDMGGIELFGKMQQCCPRLASRMVFLSGDTESVEISNFFAMTKVKYLSKPFQVIDLIDIMLELKHRDEKDEKDAVALEVKASNI